MRLTIRPLADWRGERTPASSRKHHNFTRSTGGWKRQDIPWSETLVLVLATVVALVVIAAAWIDRGRP